MKKITTEKAPAAIGPYVQGNMVNGFLFASGQIPINPQTGVVEATTIEAQTKQVMTNIQAMLEAVNADFGDIAKTTCFLTNMADFTAFNETYASFFNENLPARSCVEVSRLPKEVLVEVEVIVAVPEKTE